MPIKLTEIETLKSKLNEFLSAYVDSDDLKFQL